MKRRNPQYPHRGRSWKGTEKAVETYQGKSALLAEWEAMSDDVQIANYDYLVRLRAEVRQRKNYLLHRADPKAKV